MKLNNITKIVISIIYDVLDFTIGRIPVLGMLWDLLGTMLGWWLWGVWGLGQVWEVGEFTDQIDGFIPTLTIVGLLKTNKVIK